MPGLMGMGSFYQQEAVQGMSTAANLASQRELAEKQEAAARDQSQKTTALSGAGSGAMIGATVGGPWGALAGGIIGGVAGWFGADLF